MCIIMGLVEDVLKILLKAVGCYQVGYIKTCATPWLEVVFLSAIGTGDLAITTRFSSTAAIMAQLRNIGIKAIELYFPSQVRPG
jgi:hypothetical protein